MNALGRQLILECYDCDPDHLNDVERVERSMLEAAKAARSTIIKSVFHPFFPQGISGVVVIAESHLTIHTWPELGYAAIDVFTCGDEADPEIACDYLIEAFGARHSTTVEIKRGQFRDSENNQKNDVVVPLEVVRSGR